MAIFDNLSGGEDITAIIDTLESMGVEVPDDASSEEIAGILEELLKEPEPEAVALIPVLGVNSGLILASFNSTDPSTYRYKAFDGNDGTWTIAPMNTQTAGQYIGINFGKTVLLKSVKIKAANYSEKSSTWTMKVQYSNDGSDWKDCSEETNITVTSTAVSEHEIECTPVDCKCFRIYFTGGETYLNAATSGYVFRMHTIQAYGYDGSESDGSTVYLDGNEVEW